MPRSSRHKSHKQSKHSSRDAREHSDSEEDVKMKERNGKEEGSVRVSRESGSSEKRKLTSGEDPSGHGNGDTSGEYIASKRRKEKADVMDRWNGGGDGRGDDETVERENKGESSRGETDKTSKSKSSADGKSKSGRRYDSGNEKKEENVGLATEKEESKSSSRGDTKRKSEKDYVQKEVQQCKVSKESKDKERGLEKERKIQDIKRDAEVRAVDGDAARKQGSRSGDFGEERHGKRGRENTEWPIQDELRNPELEKELEKRIRKRRDGSSDRYQDLGKESEDRRASSRGERAKDARYKDEKLKDGSYGESKHREDGDRDTRHRDDKYREDDERSSKHKYKEDGDRDDRRRDDKYREEGEKDNRRRDDKYREDGDKDDRHREDKYREDSDRDHKHREEKYHRDDNRDDRHREDKYHEDGDRDDRHRDDRYPEDGNRDCRNREEKNWDVVGRDSRHRDAKQRDDGDRDKRLRDVKYREERASRDRASDKSDTRRLRDETGGADLHFRKTSNRDGSPIHDDRSTRYKEDKGRRRANDKEDHGDMRSRSTKEQHADAEKKYTGSSRVDSASDRGRSNSRNVDVDIILSHSRQRSSPSSSSHIAKEHYRLSKQEESKYADLPHEERVRLNLNSSREFVGVAGVSEKASLSRTIDSPVQIDDNYVGELSTERRLKSDARNSPLQMVDKSPSSMSLDRKHLSRSDVRRSLDIEDSGQRSEGSKDAKDYYGREGRGSRELPMETFPGDEFSQADRDTLSVSSPFTRTGHLSGNSRSLLPPPPFRSGAESPLVFGSLEDDNRGKSNNRYRRMTDPNMGRLQGSPWRGVPNWPSPVANGFMPFQHGPPPMGFHPMMQQFPAPPMFGVRPSMELNQPGVPYPIPESDRFSGPGRSLGWRNPVDESCPPMMHGWDPNNTVFGDESHIYGRLDWDHSNRTLSSEGRKGQSRGASMELVSVHKKEDLSGQGTADDAGAGHLGLQMGYEQKPPSVQGEGAVVDHRSDALESGSIEASKTPLEEMHDVSTKDAACLSRIYFSKLDISGDLTQPELYSQCMSLMDMDQDTNSEEDDFKVLFVEEAIETTEEISNKTSSALLFSTVSNSIFEKAMALYGKQREVVCANSGNKVPFSNVDKSVPILNQEITGANGDEAEKVVLACDNPEPEGGTSVNKANVKSSPAITNQKTDEPVLAETPENLEESDLALNKEKVESLPELKQEKLGSVAEEKSEFLENIELSFVQSPVRDGVVNGAGESKGNSLIFSDVSSEACEVVIPESGSLNLSRIHQSPESTR
ncbi:hypothetical protein NMG60_11030549 [Bertholletia excelsa]